MTSYQVNMKIGLKERYDTPTRHVLTINVYLFLSKIRRDRDSVVGILIRFGMDGLEFEPRFYSPQPSRAALGSTQPLSYWIVELFPEGKEAAAWR